MCWLFVQSKKGRGERKRNAHAKGPLALFMFDARTHLLEHCSFVFGSHKRFLFFPAFRPLSRMEMTTLQANSVPSPRTLLAHLSQDLVAVYARVHSPPPLPLPSGGGQDQENNTHANHARSSVGGVRRVAPRHRGFSGEGKFWRVELREKGNVDSGGWANEAMLHRPIVGLRRPVRVHRGFHRRRCGWVT